MEVEAPPDFLPMTTKNVAERIVLNLASVETPRADSWPHTIRALVLGPFQEGDGTRPEAKPDEMTTELQDDVVVFDVVSCSKGP